MTSGVAGATRSSDIVGPVDSPLPLAMPMRPVGGNSQPVFLALVGNPFRDGCVAIMANVNFINLLD